MSKEYKVVVTDRWFVGPSLENTAAGLEKYLTTLAADGWEFVAPVNIVDEDNAGATALVFSRRPS